jgi:SAM-dependent methyltransferase
MREADAVEGYRSWAERYDDPGNPVIAIEERAVWALTDAATPGRALDAACGTGRHARHLRERGHAVVGVDLTPEMLERAARRVPVAQADLNALPMAPASVDLAVSGLALAHLPELGPAVAELARVLRPGGRLIVSVLHPLQVLLGWHAPFELAPGQRAFVREHPHLHADYFDAFHVAGLVVTGCVEPVFTEAQMPAKRRAYRHIPEATRAAFTGLPGVLVWEAVKPW